MSLQDPIADMLSRIKNAQQRDKTGVRMPSSNIKTSICEILKTEGYIKDYKVEEAGHKKTLNIELKYFEGKPVIELLQRVSKPSLRIYRPKDDLPSVIGGLGTAVISTSKGVMTDKQARSQGIGGEILFIVA